MPAEPRPDAPRSARPARRPAQAGQVATPAQSGQPAVPAQPAAAPGGEPASILPPPSTGPQLARAVLDAARVRREANRSSRRTGGGRDGDGDGGRGAGRRLRGYSGPGPDPRDPQLFGDVLARLMKSRGWQRPAAEATVFGAWERVVGPEIAKHSRPVKLEDGELTVEAESTAWATQLRLLARSLLQRIAKEVGHNVVRKLHIHGPAAPSWSKGPRRVRGRGPRDTYG
jgi:predicted nucleic acid-binding Zn ribbon protein